MEKVQIESQLQEYFSGKLDYNEKIELLDMVIREYNQMLIETNEFIKYLKEWLEWKKKNLK